MNDTNPKTPGPDYYALADGRQFWELQKDTLIPLCEAGGLSQWETHQLLSACEHLFRMDAKLGESKSDREAFKWWMPLFEGRKMPFVQAAIAIVECERKKMGR
jgi:hypothetical protein